MSLDLVQKGAGHNPARILDVAAAQGNFSLTLAELGHDVTWNDLRSELVEYVRRKHTHGQISFLPGNIFDQDVDSHFDLILFTEVIEHVAHPDQFLSKLARLVRPGGHLVMSTPNGAYFRNNLPRFSDCPDSSVYEAQQFKPDSDGHIFLLWPDEIPTLASSVGLEVVEHRVFTNPLTAGHIKLSYLLRVLPNRFVWMLESVTQKLPTPIKNRICTASATLLRKP